MLNINPTADLDEVRERIVGVHQAVPVLDGGKRTYINFDNAASTPALQDVLRTTAVQNSLNSDTTTSY